MEAEAVCLFKILRGSFPICYVSRLYTVDTPGSEGEVSPCLLCAGQQRLGVECQRGACGKGWQLKTFGASKARDNDNIGRQQRTKILLETTQQSQQQ